MRTGKRKLATSARRVVQPGCVWFVVRTQFATTCPSTNVSCAWRTWKGPCGPSTRWNSTKGGHSGAPRGRWASQSSGTSLDFAPLRVVHLCTFVCFVVFYYLFFSLFTYIFIPLFISIHIFINNILACVVRVKVCLAGSVTAWSRLELLTAAGNSDDEGTTQVDKVWVW